MGRLGRPEEVAHAVAMFLEARAGFITGQILYVCGGVSAALQTIHPPSRGARLSLRLPPKLPIRKDAGSSAKPASSPGITAAVPLWRPQYADGVLNDLCRPIGLLTVFRYGVPM